MEVREAQTLLGERVEVGSLDIGSETSQLRESGVVEEDHHDIGDIRARMGSFGEEGFGLGHAATDATRKPGVTT
jgi:hypothetical protein